MPALYEYFGILVYFYSNEHEPIHVHGKHAGRESRAEIIVRNGRVVGIEFGNVAGKRPLEGQKLKNFETLVKAKADEIVERWKNFFVHNVRSNLEIINRKIK
ncbi:MAG TPA: DUF4160 domain-containing protein [Verrucomicrobiae bacterium]|nr:DUF4160 domain-containing protein [Verrucomicrobiae bacterium]